MNKKVNLLMALSPKQYKTKILAISTLMVFFFMGVILFSGCKKKDDGSTSNQKTTMNMRMTDAPGDYDAVYVDVIGAEVHSDVDGWVSLNVKPGIYNLLDLTNGKDTLIATGQVAVGTVSQIRLILGDRNTVVVDNKTYSLKTPSAQQSGLKLQVHADLVYGINYTMLLDFDADKSIVLTGNNTYMLKPVIRVITKVLDGGIKGVILPLTAQPAIYAISGTDSVSTYADIFTGKFFIGGLQTGAYKVVIMPKSPYSDTSVLGVNVVNGSVTDIGTITVK
ncbi:MAG: DUF4382 domain-containing protein [Bacteroidia bacterium]|nr:DUF4382 domain-containing protein [Bacteroidia bacterium]